MARKLYVPDNITLRNEVWRGLGKKELAISVLITAIVIFIAVIVVTTFGDRTLFFSMAAVLLTFSVSITMQTKLENNQSMVEFIAMVMKFKREQQKFKYKSKGERLCAVQDKNNAKS